MSEEEAALHRKVFVLTRDEYGTGEGFDHGPNMREAVRYVQQHGLAAVGTARFAGTADLPDGRSVALAYVVDAVRDARESAAPAAGGPTPAEVGRAVGHLD